jgi:tetratricopeptide (TPR) repeat protein
MEFAGELTTIGLSEVFQNVALNRLTGVLSVTERGRRAAVYLDDGMIRAFRPDADRTIDYVTIAERHHVAPSQAVRDAAKRRRRRTLKEGLRHVKDFDEVRYDAAVSAAIKEEVILLFGWRDASFVFEESRPRDGTFDREQLDCDIAIDPETVATEAARRSDEWENIAHQVETDRDIFLPTDLPLPEDATPAMREIVAKLDGTRDLSQVIGEVSHGRFEVLRLVASLSEAGFVARATPNRLRDLAHEAEEKREIHRAVRFLEAALQMDGSNLAVREELVSLYERAGRRTDAANEYKRLGRAQEESGDLDGALESYGRAAALVPYEADALERIVNIHDARGDKNAFMRAGLRLAEALSTQALLEEALDVYRRLLDQDKENVVLRESIAATYIKLHESKKAAKELLHLAQSAWQQQKFDRALHYYRNVRAVDRDCEEASLRIEEIERGRAQRRRRASRRRIVVMLSTLVFGLTFWQGTREWFAHAALHEAAHVTFNGLPRRHIDDSMVDAIALYADVRREHPYTFAGALAEETVRDLLLSELERLRETTLDDPDEAERLVRRLSSIRWPPAVKRLWGNSRDLMLEAIAARRAIIGNEE